MPHTLTEVPKIRPDDVPLLLYHGTNQGEAMRAGGLRPSNANAAGRAVYGFAWFFATEEALRYCLVQTEADGSGAPEVLVYRHVGTTPALDLRGLEKEDIEGLGGAIHGGVIEQAGAAGVLIHSATGRAMMNGLRRFRRSSICRISVSDRNQLPVSRRIRFCDDSLGGL